MVAINSLMLDLTVSRVDDLLSVDGSSTATEAGLHKRELLIPSGSYVRRKPFFLNLNSAQSPARERAIEQRSPALQLYGAIYQTEFHGARVVGQGTVITRGRHVIQESCIEYLSQGKTPPGLTAGPEETFAVLSEVSKQIEENSLLIKRPSWLNYGHWLVEGAAVLALLSEYIQRCRPLLIIGSYSTRSTDMHRIVNETIEIICPGAIVLEHSDDDCWSFSGLKYITPLHGPPSCKVPLPLERLRTFILQQAGAQPSKKRRIYLSRNDQNTRRVENEDEVRRILENHGFETIFLKGLSLLDQAALFNQCEAIIGVKGAALTNILFCRPTCDVMVLSPENWPDPFFFDIANQQGLRYGELFCTPTTGPVAGHHDFFVDPMKLKEMLDAFSHL